MARQLSEAARDRTARELEGEPIDPAELDRLYADLHEATTDFMRLIEGI